MKRAFKQAELPQRRDLPCPCREKAEASPGLRLGQAQGLSSIRERIPWFLDRAGLRVSLANLACVEVTQSAGRGVCVEEGKAPANKGLSYSGSEGLGMNGKEGNLRGMKL